MSDEGKARWQQDGPTAWKGNMKEPREIEEASSH